MINGIIINNPGSTREEKTGKWRTGLKPEWSSDKCRHCAVCFHFCPENAIIFRQEKMTGIDYDYCKGCGICVSECPFRALKMVRDN